MTEKPGIRLAGVRGAIIDLDGTMLDTSKDLHQTINRIRHDLGMSELACATVIGFVGKGAEHLVRCALRIDLPEHEADALQERAMQLFNRHYRDINGQFATPYPEVHEGLQAMREKNLRLGCVTNKPLTYTLPLLEKTGLRDYFELVYGGDSFARKKPDPMQLLQASQAFDLEPAQLVMIGDSSNDAQAARAAGCPVLIVPYGYNHGQPVQDIDSDGIVSSLLAAAQLISH